MKPENDPLVTSKLSESSPTQRSSAKSFPVVAGYRMVRALARNGQTQVYLAVQESLNRPVAVKILSDPKTDHRFRALFLQEGQILGQLHHPHVITVHDFGEFAEGYFIVMEYAHKGTLSEHMRRGLGERRLVVVTRQILNALAYIHRRGIIHRDIKPTNILFRQPHQALLSDFGIADRRRSASGKAVGTPGYMSPEQLQGLPLDARSDLYSLGVVFHKLLMSHYWHQVDAKPGLIQQNAPKPGGDPSQPLPAQFKRYQAVLDGLLQTDVEQRFADADTVINALDAVTPLQWLVDKPSQETGGDEPPTKPESTARTENQSFPSPPGLVEAPTATPADTGPTSFPTLPLRAHGETTGGQLPSWRSPTIPPTNPLPWSESPRRGAPRWPWAVGAALLSSLCIAGAWWFTVPSTNPGAASAAASLAVPRPSVAQPTVDPVAMAPVQAVVDKPPLMSPPEPPPAAVDPRRPSKSPLEVLPALQASAAAIPVGGGLSHLPDFAEFRDCDICPLMIKLPPAEFTMGSNDNVYSSEYPAHRVHRSYPVAISRFEITVAEYDHYRRAVGLASPDRQDHATDVNYPVTQVSWDDAMDYTQWLGMSTGYNYRLPSEAEWEYAARATQKSKYPWGNWVGSNNANCLGCRSPWDNQQVAPVGSFAANAFGLYDTAGNVLEWVADCWNNDYHGAPDNGTPWLQGDCRSRIVRGGAWNTKPLALRVTHRDWRPLDTRSDNLGFRVVRE
ncbi:MAG: SUMF1/EgtB/PvdO family nonheme iron enzyme [Candidatus Competibacterales bacterium]